MESIIRRATKLYVAVALLGGCMAPDDQLAAYVSPATSRPIYHGTADDNPDHMAVVALTWVPGTDIHCSGVLVSEDVVLTAGHCLENVQPNEVGIFFGQNVEDGGEYRDVDHFLVHPHYDVWELLADISIIRLATPAPAWISPIPHLPLAKRLTSDDVGQKVDFSGFGLTESGSDGVKLHVGGTIELVCAGPAACDDGIVAGKAFSYPQDAGGPCTGDSGGPAFVLRDDREYVAGLTSYGDVECNIYGVSTSVSDYAAWIEGFLSTGGNEVCTGGVDDDGDTYIDCEDGDCSVYPDCVGASCGIQCPLVLFTECTCSSTDPCGWVNDGYCNRTCATSFPGDHFDDSADCGNLENCDNGIDDDGDTLFDCFDPDCASFPGCREPEQDCDNEIDDDGDSNVDCQDSDCALASTCQPSSEDCLNGVDDDADGAIDCNDPNCIGHEVCQEGCDCSSRGGGDALLLLTFVALLPAWRKRGAHAPK